MRWESKISKSIFNIKASGGVVDRIKVGLEGHEMLKHDSSFMQEIKDKYIRAVLIGTKWIPVSVDPGEKEPVCILVYHDRSGISRTYVVHKDVVG